MKKTMPRLAGVAIALLLSTTGITSADSVKVGVMYDATGPVSASSVPYAKGIQAATRWINGNDGINGKDIELLVEDYGYQIPRALSIYKKMRGEGVVAIQGFGSGDTEALMPSISKDKLPWFSASYSANLTDPSHAPYNYSVGADYSAQVRAALKHMSESWTDTTRRPRLALVYMDNAFGKSVIPAIESYAKELDIDFVGREVVNADALEAVGPLTRIRDLNTDFILLQQIATSFATIVRDARKLGIDSQVYGTVWTYDPQLIEVAGEGANGVIVVQIAALSARGLEIEEAIASVAETPTQIDDHNFLRGWGSMMVMAEAMRVADAAGNLTGEGIKAALDTGEPFSTGGILPPVSYTATDHRSTNSTMLYRLENLKPVLIGPVEVERRDDWLGN